MSRRRQTARVAAQAGAACLAVLAVVLGIRAASSTPTAAPAPRPSTSSAPSTAARGDGPLAGIPAELRDAVTWLGRNTTSGSRLVVPRSLVARVSTALPDRTVVDDRMARQDGDLVLFRPRSGAAVPPRDPTLTPAARFGSDRHRAWVLQVGDAQVASPAERDVARQASRELAANDRLRFTSRARAVLAGGGLDPRLLVTLNGLALDHRASIDVRPDPAAQAAGAPLRSVVVTRVDARPISSDAAARSTVQYLRSQAAVYRPLEPLRARAGGLLVSYGLPAPQGVLTGATFPST